MQFDHISTIDISENPLGSEIIGRCQVDNRLITLTPPIACNNSGKSIGVNRSQPTLESMCPIDRVDFFRAIKRMDYRSDHLKEILIQ